MISYQEVGARYDGAEKWAIRDISLQIEGGEIVALLGPSGCGKTSTMKLANGLLVAEEGCVEVDGRDIREWEMVKLRRHLGYVVQSGGLFPHLTAGENVGLLGELEGWSPTRIRRRVEELFSLVELDSAFATRLPAELSGGQAQRVSIARALMLDPPALLMDEPFSALDPLTKAEIQNWFRDWVRELKKTVLWVTHDGGAAFALADRMVVMDRGKIMQLGDAETLRASPATEWVRRFLEVGERLS